MKEKYFLERKKVSKFILRHNSRFRLRWDLFVMLLAIYNCISIPFNAAFAPEASIFYDLFESLVDVCFAIDIFINFRTTYINSSTGLEVTGGCRIAITYIKSG